MEFSEAIAVNKNKIYNISYHNKRMNYTRKQLFGAKTELNLAAVIDTSQLDEEQLYKCRVLYNQNIVEVTFSAYTPKHPKTFKIVDGGTINYTYKNADRSLLNELFSRRGECDEVLIAKNGTITDASSANVIFYNGKQWVTPDTPLLKGTQRQQLLDNGTISTAIILISDIMSYSKMMLINALLPFDEQRAIVDLKHCIF